MTPCPRSRGREKDTMLTTRDLIAMMTPTALAEVIASVDLAGNLYADERETADYLREVLACNVGDLEARAMIADAAGD